MDIDITDIPVYYINLDKDVEKRDRLEQNLANLGFKNVNRFAGHYSSERAVGCATSHNLLLHELKNMETPFLVLEDDVEVYKFKKIIKNVPDNAEALYLGNSVFGLWGPKGEPRIAADKVDNDIYRVYNMLGAHAILYLNSDYVKFLARATDLMVNLKDNQDKSRAHTMRYFDVYALNNPIFYQAGKHEKVTKVSISKLNYFQKNKLFTV